MTGLSVNRGPKFKVITQSEKWVEDCLEYLLQCKASHDLPEDRPCLYWVSVLGICIFWWTEISPRKWHLEFNNCMALESHQHLISISVQILQ